MSHTAALLVVCALALLANAQGSFLRPKDDDACVPLAAVVHVGPLLHVQASRMASTWWRTWAVTPALVRPEPAKPGRPALFLPPPPPPPPPLLPPYLCMPLPAPRRQPWFSSPTPAGKLLGFNNRTCQAGTKTRPAGPGVGPSLRAATASNSWTTFSVTVTDGDLATLSTFVAEGAAQPLCVGNLVAEKAAACADPRVHIHPASQAGSDTEWRLTPTSGNAFTIAYTGRTDGCAVYLSASAACGTAAPFLAPADGSALQQWRLTPVASRWATH
jgi:DNA-binding beta-propeller fold protein YncE